MFKILNRAPTWLLLLFSHILVAALGYVDYLTGDYSILIFYLVPISLVAWLLGVRDAILISLAAGAARIVSDYYSYSGTTLMYWNSLLDMAFLLMAGLLIALLKKLLVEEQSRIVDELLK